MARVYKLKSHRPSRLGIDYRAALNGEQRDVVTAPLSPLLVLAGAGSGKTRALTYRVARMIDQGVPPEGIYVLTFTNRSAKEMLQRVEELCGATARQVTGGTFHSVANFLLRRHAEAIGYSDNFTILDVEDAKEVMAAAIVDCGINPKKSRFPKPDLLLNIASHAINTQTPAREVITDRAPRFYNCADEITQACRAYIERKAAMNLMDFDDLLMNWKVLLEEVPAVSESLAKGCRAILVDEYQDTNSLQADIVDQMARVHKNVTVVGDDAQCIYGFRGAEVENMLSFGERYPEAVVLPLEVNYRSTPEILMLANATLRRMTRGYKKDLRAIKPNGSLPALIPCRDVYMQAEFVAQRILEMRDEGIPLDDIGILYRAHSHAMEIQVELTRRGIPFLVRSGLRFFEQAHIKDVLAYMKFIYNPDDELSFRRAVKLHDGVGNATADTLWHEMKDLIDGGFSTGNEEHLIHLVNQSGKRAKGGVESFIRIIAQLSQSKIKERPGEMIRLILERPPMGAGYGDLLDKSFQNGEERKEDIDQLADYAAGFNDLETFLSELSLLTNFSVEEAVAADEPDEKVTLSSIHQAKGLEWGRVFIPWMIEGRLPSDLALREVGGEDEERRLFYVAVTRAKDELVLTYPQIHRSRDSSQVLLRRSRFVDELPEPREDENGDPLGLYEVWQIEEDPIGLLGDDEEEGAELDESDERKRAVLSGVDDRPEGSDDDLAKDVSSDVPKEKDIH
ncbi:MAG: ATP-dependent helicase [Deltaproteobacteria bacterium]|nr:ATP-dependent helicase [Deltaproteobacteria bacterium]